MELLETQDPDKKRLIETSERHKREVEKELKSMKVKSERLLTNALIIGGSLALTYVVISQLTSSRRKKKNKEKEGEAIAPSPRKDENGASDEPSLISQIGTKVMNQAALILLDIAKDKLMEYLESRKQRNENS